MQSTDTKSFQDRLSVVGILKDAFAALAGVHPSDVSRHSKGYHVSPARVAHMNKVLEELEDLAAADTEVRIDFSSVANIKAAQKRLAEYRAKPAEAPWQRALSGATSE